MVRERLWGGATGPNWEPLEPDAPSGPPVVMGPGGPLKVDPHPGDAPEGLYHMDPELRGDDLDSRRAYSRESYHNGNPMVLRHLECHRCGRGATFYGRADLAPPRPFTCDRCSADGGLDAA